MKMYGTTIFAISPLDGSMREYCGPNVPGISVDNAREYCENNGLGYCHVHGELVCEIPCKEGTYEPDFNNMIDYENPTLN
jgi:hypothetical protein